MLKPEQENRSCSCMVCRQMHSPVLLLQGALDPAQPRWYFERAVSLFPDAELHVVPDAGYFIELERPDIVTAEIRTWVRRSKADHAWRPREDESWL
jgi:pimeloyl-ACP methyl ester carboxylesterase